MFLLVVCNHVSILYRCLYQAQLREKITVIFSSVPYTVIEPVARCVSVCVCMDNEARSTLSTMSKQHCRSNRQLCCLLLRQCCRFGQQCRSNVRPCRKDEISTQTRSTLLPFWQQSRTLLRHCCWCGPGLTVSCEPSFQCYYDKIRLNFLSYQC